MHSQDESICGPSDSQSRLRSDCSSCDLLLYSQVCGEGGIVPVVILIKFYE